MPNLSLRGLSGSAFTGSLNLIILNLKVQQLKSVIKADNHIEPRCVDAGAMFAIALIKQILKREGESVVLGHL